jgi:hypothetical protein
VGIDATGIAYYNGRDGEGKTTQHLGASRDGKTNYWMGERGGGHDFTVVADPDGSATVHVGAAEKGTTHHAVTLVAKQTFGGHIAVHDAAGQPVFAAPEKK